ncbi:MAG: hypothetical protein WCJ30_08255 [Deltaproteobacteria bacterium]
MSTATIERHEHERETLAGGTDGAIMVLGLFMALFLVGALYFLMGIGHTVMYRERMQDASDAAAFSAAVMDARGMNLIALINIIMACALAILVALRAVQLICVAGMALAAALAVPTWGASLAAIPPLAELESSVSELYNSLEPEIMEFLELGHTAEVVIKNGMPVVAIGKAVVITMGAYRPPVDVGFAIPDRFTLPLETAPFSDLCRKAAEYTVALVELPLRPIISVLGPVWSPIHAVLSAFAQAAAATVCGGSASMPHIDADFSIGLPESPQAHMCTSGGGTRDERRAACDEAQRIEQTRQYDPVTGNCVGGSPPGSTTSGCNTRVSDAASQCQPGGGANRTAFIYQLQDVTYTINKLADGTITRTLPAADPMRFPNPYVSGATSTPMCGTGGSVSTNYDPGGPLCEPTQPDLEAPHNGEIDALVPGSSGSVVIAYTRVLHVLACKEPRDQPTDGISAAPIDGGDNRSPMRVLPDANLGDDNFQLWGFVIGHTDFDREERGVRAANSFRDDTSTTSAIFRTLRQLGRINVAQAEFYFDGSEDRVDWMYNMFWRARLRRVRIPGSVSSGSSLRSGCESSNSGSSGGGDCSGTSGLDLSILDHLIIH